MKNGDQYEIQRHIDHLGRHADGHAELLLAADAQVVVHGKVDRNQRAENGVNPEIDRAEADGFLAGSGGKQDDKGPCKEEAQRADRAGED